MLATDDSNCCGEAKEARHGNVENFVWFLDCFCRTVALRFPDVDDLAGFCLS